jgi:hypothetical protein
MEFACAAKSLIKLEVISKPHSEAKFRILRRNEEGEASPPEADEPSMTKLQAKSRNCSPKVGFEMTSDIKLD